MELKRSGAPSNSSPTRCRTAGVVATYADISARVAADLALKRANESLEQRVRTARPS
jgi:hypothetical protein